MGEYFKPWRRKIGMMTLVLACVGIGAWVRSLGMSEGICFPARNRAIDYAESEGGGLCWRRIHGSPISLGSSQFYSQPISFADPNLKAVNVASEEPDENLPVGAYFKWRWRLCGFSVGETMPENGQWEAFLVIPYWSIVIPLTLLSAYLLLSKPRQSTAV